MSISEYFKDYSILKLSQGFLYTFYFSYFAGGFYPTVPTNFTPMNLEFENSIEFYLYDLKVYVLQIDSISISEISLSFPPVDKHSEESVLAYQWWILFCSHLPFDVHFHHRRYLC